VSGETFRAFDLVMARASKFTSFLVVLGAAAGLLLVVLFPIAAARTGSGGVVGLFVAAVICLATGILSEAISRCAGGAQAPLWSLLAGMAVRMLPPLAICCLLAVRGESGMQHLAFVCYLLAFYLVTLAVETWFAVRRAQASSANQV
jgi:hypothetical protein